MVGSTQIDSDDRAELVWLPVVGRLETKACWVDKWHYGKVHAAIRKVNTAGAAIVLHSYTQEVLVSDIFCMTCRLHSSHQELVFW